MTTRKKHKKREKHKKHKTRAKGTGESFKNKKVIISQLSQKKLPEDLTKRIQRHFAATTMQKYSRKYVHTKKQLQARFEKYNQNTGEDYDPMDPELTELVKVASRILKRHDYKNPFWRKVMGLIYIGLHEEQYTGGPGSQYYNKTEDAFKKILKNVMNYEETHNYLEDEYLYTELVEYVLGHND
jgi:hypothetical protein